jgi:putative tryptophan/tyrosine transport system substrate-binding protein
MRRRDFLSIVAGAAAWPIQVNAQQSSNRIPVVGVLWHASNADEEDVYLSVLRKAFHDLGYTEGKNIVLEHRFPAENPDRFRTLGQELIDLKPDAIIAITALGAVTLTRLTQTIPIIFVFVPDPVASGLVKSLARPGGNATGVSLMAVDLSGKRLQLLKEAVPKLARVALLLDRKTDPMKVSTIKANQAAANALGIYLQPFEMGTPEEVEPVFVKISQDQFDGVVLGPGSGLFNMRALIGAAALAHKLPIATYIAEEVPYGLLLSYGQDFPDYVRRAATYVDRILKEAKPADLPVEQPTTLKLVLDRKTAKALDLTFPASLLTTADEVIE